MPRKRLSPADVRAALRARWQSHWRNWLAGEGSWPFSMSLGAPSEGEVGADPAVVREWIAQWREAHDFEGLVWEDRAFKRLGVQTLPVRVMWPHADAVAKTLGEARAYARAAQRYATLRERFPAASRLHRAFDVLGDYSDADFARLVRLLEWLVANRASGLYLRQLPVPDVDTKWVAARRASVTDMLRDIHSDPNADFFALSGLQREPVRLRMRVLCPMLAAGLGGLADVEVPVAQAARLALNPQHFIVVENLETGIALPEWSGTVAFMKLGHGVEILSRLPWLAGARPFYWGDLDTHGFVILARMRRYFPATLSVLMDEETLLAHRDLWVTEPTPNSATELVELTAAERNVFDGLRDDRWGRRVRLEQERVAWPYALAQLIAALRS